MLGNVGTRVVYFPAGREDSSVGCFGVVFPGVWWRRPSRVLSGFYCLLICFFILYALLTAIATTTALTFIVYCYYCYYQAGVSARE